MDRENAWRRGWSDTKAAVTSWWFVLADAALGLLTGVVVANWKGTLWGAGAGAGALLGFAFLLLLWNLHRAPIRQRNEAWAREEQRDQLRPGIETQLEARITGGHGARYHLLRVTNPSGVTISDYYAKFRDFRDSCNQTIDFLMGYELYWHKAGRDLPEKRISIPCESSEYIHLFTTYGREEYSDYHTKIMIAQIVNGVYNTWQEGLNSTSSDEYYSATLEIGSYSEKISVPPVKVRLKITYHGNHELSAEIKAGQLQAKL